MQNFLQQLQTPLSQKPKTFSGIFIPFLKCAWKLEHFEKKDECISLIISEIIVPKEVATEMSRRSCFRTPFGNQRINWFQTPLKVARHHYYHFSHEIQVKSVGKRLLYCDHKSKDCLLTHWPPMATLPAAICKIFSNNFKRFYLKNGRLFLDILFHFWNVHKI